jgi:hypothetical protein
MVTKEQLQLRVYDDLVLHAGIYEDASGCPSRLTGPLAAILEGSRPLAADAGVEPLCFTLAR